MLTRFKVSGYRCFSNELDLNLANTRSYGFNTGAVRSGVVKDALIYGKNAVGKSNLGRALFDASDTMLGSAAPSTGADPSYLNADSRTETAHFSYTLDIDDVEVVYSYAKTDRYTMAGELLSIDGEVVYEYDYPTSRWVENRLSKYGAGDLNYEFMDSSLPVLKYACNNVPLRNLGPIGRAYEFLVHMRRTTDPETDFKRILGHAATRIITADAVGDLQKFLGYFGIDDPLAVHRDPSGVPTLYFEKSRRIPFIENCSSGTGALVRLFRALYLEGDTSILYVDEFDAFYHYALAESVVAYLRDHVDMQVVAATHNTDLFSNKVLRPDCLFILSRDGVVSAADATRRELREGHNLEKLYKAGEFDNAPSAIHN